MEDIKSLLALDVGGGTQDVLIWKKDQAVENAVKMVLPSPTHVLARRMRQLRDYDLAIHLRGWLMGGGAMARAVREHLDSGLKVYATAEAAATLYDDLDKVRDMGVEITEDPPRDATTLVTTDVDLVALRQACGLFEVDLPGRLAVAVCDHGHGPEGYSNRKFRFDQWRAFLRGGGHLLDMITANPDPKMTRMRAVVQQAPRSLVMDTAAAAAWGALQDPDVARRADQGLCIVNVGNMHTVAFLIREDRVLGIFEHHTGCLDTATLGDQVARFIAGTLDDQEVWNGDGHGCARVAEAPTEVAGPVVLTGPRRAMAQGLGWQTAYPFGDVMLSGCFGLVAAARAKLSQAA